MPSLTVAISGTSGAGKSTLIAGVAAALAPAAVVRFDDYETTSRYPDSMRAWLDEGADVDAFVTPQFAADLRALRAGQQITLPDGRMVAPAPLLLIEEPFGRRRSAMRELIDRVVLLDIPLDVALARKTLRMLDHFTQHEGLEAYAQHLHYFMPWYIADGRDSYLAVNEQVALDCDLVLDGNQPAEALVTQVTDWLHAQLHTIQRI